MNCSTGIKQAVNKYVEDKPYLRFNGDNFIQIIESVGKRITPDKFYGVAGSTANYLNNRINSDIPLGKVFYPTTINSVVGVSISPSDKQLSLLNAKEGEEYNNALQELEKEIPERDRLELENDTTFNVDEFGDSSVQYQSDELPSSIASEATLNKVKEAAKKMGIDIQSLTEYAKSNPNVNTKNINGLADLTKKIIAIATGREGEALTEEMVHIATAMIEQVNPKMITELISKIDRFKIYKDTLETYKNKKTYQLPNGKPDIRKIKKEAVDKLIAELIVNNNEGTTQFPELLEERERSIITKWWEAILDAIRSMYRTANINIFEEVASQVMKGEGNINDIKSGGIFLQAKNDVVDEFYNKFIDIDKRTEYFPTIGDVKRHYLFDGEPVYRSVTEKVKSGNTMPERTASQKIMDDQKKEWGTEGHDFMENYISNNLIDENGYARETFLDDPIENELNPSIQKALKDFTKELIRSYPKGTRFLIEKKVVNTKEKGMLASKVDFVAIEPTPEGGMKIDTLDWKFTSIDKSREEDIPWYKQKEWIPQMGEYTKIERNYGATSSQLRKARMIPFIINYDYALPGNRKSGLYAASIEIGKLDSLKETNLYLLPVPTDTESTGSKSIDALVKSLSIHYDKLAKQYVSPENKEAKDLRLKELSKAIRSLRMRLDFAPLSNVGITFLRNVNRVFKTFEDVDYSILSKEDVIKKLGDLLEFKNSAEKFATLDKTYLENFPKEGMDKEAKEIFSSLEDVSNRTERMLDKITELQKEYVVQLALKEEVTTEETKENILSPELEIKGVFSAFSEASRLGSRIIKLATNLLLNTRSATNIEMNSLIKKFGDVLIPLETLASSQGKKAFSYIGNSDNGKLSLIKKLDKKLFDDVHEAKTKKNKKFFIDNINMDEYKVLAKDVIEKGKEEINRTHYSSNEEDNLQRREYEIKNLENSVNINSHEFDGWTSFRFNRLFRQTLKEEPHYSEEYKTLLKNKEAFNVWSFLTALNQRAIENGYLSNKDSSFFALIEASMLQRLSNSKSILKESGDLFDDLYKIRINEEEQYSKIDPETNQLKKAIPKLFTRTDKEVKQLSTDLTKVGTVWIKYLLEYEAARHMENTLLTLEAVERAKEHIVTDEKGDIIWENGLPKIEENENANANRLQTIIDDNIYGLREDLSSIGSTVLSSVTDKLSKDEETSRKKAISIKKGLESGNALTQSLAVGLKLAIAIPNYFGNHFQSFINSGGLYKYSEFFKNHIKMTTSINLSTIEKGLLDMFVPLNGDPHEEGRRKLAFKQGYVKWLGTWTMQQAMMSTNFLPERNLQFTNALSMIDNAMIQNGKIVNIRQYLKKKELSRYKEMSFSERRTFEKGFEERVNNLKESSSLSKIAKIEGDEIIIPDVSKEELAKFRTKIVEWGRNLNGQMSQENKAGYRRDVMLKSLAMFRNWIPKQISLRGHDISKNLETGDWEYGRTRAFMKTWVHLGLKSTFKMLDVIRGTEKGLAILDDLLQQKKEDYYKKTGQQLEITTEEFYDMMRRELSNEMKELGMLLGLIALVIGAKIASPPDDEDPLTKNQYKYWAKVINKISNEVDFYYDPLSFTSMTQGNFLPALGLVTKAQRAFINLGEESYGTFTNDDELIDKAHPIKYFLDMVPIASQFEREWIPLFDPELAKSMGIKVVTQPRVAQ